MIMLILGLLIFLGIHCVGFAPEWRQRRVDSMGLLPWKGLYSLIALAGFVLIILGFQRARLDPVVLYTVWAFGHLLSIGLLHDVVLFGAFLVWAIVAFARLRRRDRAQGVTYAPGTLKGDIITVVVGVVAWALFAFWLHGALIGVRPFG